MLPYQASNLFPGRNQRQNSTPTSFNTFKTSVPPLRRQHKLHRRGLSFDQTRHPQDHNGIPPQDEGTTSVEHMLRQRLTQQTMQEAQQQQLQTARPGQDEIVYQYLTNVQEAPCPEPGPEFVTIKCPPTPLLDFDEYVQLSLQDENQDNSVPMFQGFDSTTSARNLDGFGSGSHDLDRNTQCNDIMNTRQDPPRLPSRAGSQRPNSREGPQRPCTPPSQIAKDNPYFPMTPATTPFSESVNVNRSPEIRTADNSPTRRDPNMTIKASHAMQRGSSCQDNFAAMREHAMSHEMPSPPRTAPLNPRSSLDLAAFPQPNFFNMSNLKMDIPPWDGGNDGSNYSPISNAVSSTISSFQSSPEITHTSLFEGLEMPANGRLMASSFSSLPSSQGGMDHGVHSSPVVDEEPPKRSQSMSEIDQLECIDDTGVTCDEIAAFISLQDSENKWTCMWLDCNKKFGRKENIKSHVQTHLDDRQFRCRDCNKRFVRQHDLKRHANIHTGVKSYACPCGKVFARHDALTRHRQRGMCEGAFEGTPKKVIKRGRPKKTRLDTEERLEKSAKTRQRVLEKRYPGKYTSSLSGSSVSSAYPSPEQLFDDMDFITSSPSHNRTSLEQVSNDLPSDVFSYTPPMSPTSYSTGNCFSSQNSQHSYTPKALSMSPSTKVPNTSEKPQQLPDSQVGYRRSSSSYFSTPPELDVSSSSPAASKFFDFDGSSEANSSSVPLAIDSTSGFLTRDFDLSVSLTKDEAPKSANSLFDDFFNTELEMTGFHVSSLIHSPTNNALTSDNQWSDSMST